jgi:hypothetical protein
MNEKKAKALRRKVYGDQSLKGPRDTQTLFQRIKQFVTTGTIVEQVTGTVVCTGLRREYQDAKRGHDERRTV